MRHYIPLQATNGAWLVAYGNHRGEFIGVMECGSLEAAYKESEAMTLEATKRALCGLADPEPRNYSALDNQGNRYLRRYA